MDSSVAHYLLENLKTIRWQKDEKAVYQYLQKIGSEGLATNQMTAYSCTTTKLYVSGHGNQRDNGPHQDQIFDNPSALCLALWAKNQIWLGVWGCGGGGGGGNWYTQ